MLVNDERPVPNPGFFGRQKELEWLLDRFRHRWAPIVIAGPGGVGKTALINQFFASVRTSRPPVTWTLRDNRDAAMVELTGHVEYLYRDRNRPEIVAIDDADTLSERDMNQVASRLLNLKAVRTVIFATRRRPDTLRAEVLELGPLGTMDAENMLKRLLGSDVAEGDLARAATLAQGLPLALSLLADFARARSPQAFSQFLRGEVYNLERGLIIPKKDLIADVKPKIILANQALVESLRKQPQSVFELPPRKFEELIAELLADLGYEVELTPATRDGGKDILAYMSTPHGRLLCLVEAKKYRMDRPIGVELVRQLYGTLIDADASSAMLVTTSSFSPDAHAFQRRHQYKLALRDYGNVVEWIQGYRRG